MKVHKTISIALIYILMSGCSAGISRHGYSPTDHQAPANCRILVLGYIPFDAARMELLGSVDLYDTGLSLYCDEEYGIELMKKEACLVGADIVNITDEKFPDFWSTCYRAKANLIRLKNREEVALIEADPHYSRAKVRERSMETWARIQDAIQAGMIGGIMGGVMAPH